jgi:hypothetical protein
MGGSLDFDLYHVVGLVLPRCRIGCNWRVLRGMDDESSGEFNECHVCLVSSPVHHCWPMLTFSFSGRLNVYFAYSSVTAICMLESGFDCH